MQYRIIPVTPFQQNCTLLWCEKPVAQPFVDPGGEVDRLLAEIEKEALTLERILLTHGHVDHVGGAAELAQRTGVPIDGPQREEASGSTPCPSNAGCSALRRWRASAQIAGWRKETSSWSERSALVLFHPGTYSGPYRFLQCHRKACASGGCIVFRLDGNCTDFPRGSLPVLLESIRAKLWPLGDDVRFIPGHGPMRPPSGANAVATPSLHQLAKENR